MKAATVTPIATAIGSSVLAKEDNNETNGKRVRRARELFVQYKGKSRVATVVAPPAKAQASSNKRKRSRSSRTTTDVQQQKKPAEIEDTVDDDDNDDTFIAAEDFLNSLSANSNRRRRVTVQIPQKRAMPAHVLLSGTSVPLSSSSSSSSSSIQSYDHHSSQLARNNTSSSLVSTDTTRVGRFNTSHPRSLADSIGEKSAMRIRIECLKATKTCIEDTLRYLEGLYEAM